MQTLQKYREKTDKLHKKFNFVTECMNYSYCCKPGVQIRIPLNPESAINTFNRLNSNR